MAHIIHTLKVELDLNRPVEELAQVISSVLNSLPGRQKEILEALDLEVGNALATFKTEKPTDTLQETK
ncbi:hypothetical protein D3C75_590360 [compost metagenome]